MQVKVSESFPPMPVVEVAVGPMQMEIISSLHTISLSPEYPRLIECSLPSSSGNRFQHLR